MWADEPVSFSRRAHRPDCFGSPLRGLLTTGRSPHAGGAGGHMKISNLFDSNRDIYRTIEKVITYGASQENRIKAEISEYVVTDSIEEQFRKLLDRMQLAMESGENEIGVWVSGFYGSGKSS